MEKRRKTGTCQPWPAGRASLILPRTMPNLLEGKAQPGCPTSNLVSTFWAPFTGSISPVGVSIPAKTGMMSCELGEEVMRPSRSSGRKVLGGSHPSNSQQNRGGRHPPAREQRVQVFPWGKAAEAEQVTPKGGLEGWGCHPPLLCSLTPLHSLRVHDPGDHHCQLHRAGPGAAPPRG